MPRLGSGDALIDERFVLAALPRREPGAHKWGVGGVVIVGGAPGYVGAPALCALAAGRVGAGITVLAVPRSIVGAVAGIVPEAAFIPLPDGDPRISGRRAYELISDRLHKAKAAVIGPGMGDDEYADALMGALVAGSESNAGQSLGFFTGPSESDAEAIADGLLDAGTPVVLDADALNWLARRDEWWHSLREHSAVLTPHVGEMSRLLGCGTDEILSDPIAAARAAAVRWKQTVVLKYGYSVATDGDRALVSPDAPVSLATAGSGDVLAGAIGGLLAQGLAPLDAAAFALYVGGKAALRAEDRVGVLGLIARDLPLAMAEEIRDLERKRGDRRD